MRVRGAYICVALTTLLSATAAHAQYYQYDSGKPQVEMNLDALDALPAKPGAVPPVARMKLTPPPAPPTPPVAEEPDAAPEAEAEPAPVAAPAHKRLLKPFFTEPTPAEEVQEDIAAEKPLPRKAAPAPKKREKKIVAAPQKPAAPVAQDVTAPEAPVAPVPVKPAETPPPVEAPVPPAALPLPPAIPAPANRIPMKPEAEAPKAAPHEPPASAVAVPELADLTLAFDGNGSDITPALQQKMDAVVKQLTDDATMRLQVRAYATGEEGNTSSARRISLSRALSVRSYLMDKGIKPNRVDVRALGTETDHAPLDRVDLVFVR